MKIRAIDENGDWVFGNGLGSYKEDIDAISQHITTRLREWYNDCWFNTNAGIDFPNRTQSPDVLEIDIKTIIVETDGVVGLDNFTATFVGREVFVTFTALTIYSESVQNTINLQLTNA